MPTNHTINQMKWDKENRRVYGFRLHKTLDKDVIDKLDSVPSMQGYIKQLIRQDVAAAPAISDDIIKDLETQASSMAVGANAPGKDGETWQWYLDGMSYVLEKLGYVFKYKDNTHIFIDTLK